MTSEAVHHHGELAGDAQPPTQPNVPKESIGELVPFPLRESEPDTDTEKLDFSEVSSEVAVEFLMSQLNHPSRNQRRGIELATDIEALVPTKAGKALDPTTLEGRLIEIIHKNMLTNDEMYEHKIDHDAVFQLLVNKLLYTRDRRDMRTQFEVTRDLAQLRSTVGDETAEDDEWRNVIDRLFS